MRMRWLRACVLLAAFAPLSCGTRHAVNTEGAEDTTTRLGDKIEISLADWLVLPRPELAELVSKWTETVEKQQAYAREHPESVDLLPQLHPPLTVPVFAQARFSAGAGLSLPPYLKEGEKDSAVALHLARHGDAEAARKLVDPADAEAQGQIRAEQAQHNYPVEWTRLVALAQQSAQYKLANGEVEGATELVQLHKQLQSVLDQKAANGPLGAALLPSGRRALALAASSWREPKLNKTALARDIDEALAAWGQSPEPAVALRPGAAQAEVTRLFGAEARGRTVRAATPDAVRRALDLLALPLPDEGVEAVVAFLNGERLAELTVLYRPKINELYPEPEHLAHHLVDHDVRGQEPVNGPGLHRQSYRDTRLNYDVMLLTLGNAAGALVRVAEPGAREGASNVPRDFGAVHLDRSFEQNRLLLAPELGGSVVTVEKAQRLARIKQPVSRPAPVAAVLQRETEFDLLASLALRWPAEVGEGALVKLGLPLWAAYGSARVEAKEDVTGGYLLLTWEDGKTRVQLRLPQDRQPPELVAEDARGNKGLEERAAAARELNREERAERLKEGKPQKRLARSLPFLQGVLTPELGQGRSEALAALPRSSAIRWQNLRDGVSLVFLTEPSGPVTNWPRQMFLRFGPDGRVAEVRVRYQTGLRVEGKVPTLLQALRKANGAPEQLPAPWAELWQDLPRQKPAPVLYRWLDDFTVLTYQADSGGAEVVLRDCPADQPLGVQLPPLRFCGRGVEGCQLGEERTELLRKWQVTQPPTANGAEVLTQPASSPYDVVLLWYEDGKVSRIIARHRGKPLQAAAVGPALQQAWSRDFDHLGYLRRKDGPIGQVLQGYGWHDDRTRVRVFAQETEQGARLFTEWRNWPVAAKAVAAQP